jgi:fatty acyl-CoA reductase
MAQLQVKPLAVLATVPDTQGIVEAQDLCIGGRSYPDRRHLRWVLRQPHGSGVIRLFGYMVAKTLRLAADEVTFDRGSFERALREIPQGTLVIIAPTHRSYMDFLLCSFLFFSQPELGVAIPHIAAAEEFSRIPILGRLFERAQAFFVRRGMQRQDYVALTARVTDLVTRQQTLQVFIEGTRSRSRQFLPPRHGLLRCIQETGQVATILPVAISYDRVTEEASFLEELAGKPKPTMKLRALSAWALRLLRGEIKIGRVHIACGMPIKLDKTDRLRHVTRGVMGQLQRHTVATTFHLRSFLAHYPVPGVDADWLREAIVARGGRVLQSSCPAANTSALMERCLRYQWMHLFYAEARLAYPDNPAVQHHIARNCYCADAIPVAPAQCERARLAGVLHGLFASICHDYALVAETLGTPEQPLDGLAPEAVLRRHPEAFLPDVEAAFDALCKAQILAHGKQHGTYRWGARSCDLQAFRAACELPNPAQLG